VSVREEIINFIYHHQFMIRNNTIHIFIALCASSKANFQGLWALGKNVNVNVEVNENSTWFFFSQCYAISSTYLRISPWSYFECDEKCSTFVCAFTFLLIHNFCGKFYTRAHSSYEHINLLANPIESDDCLFKFKMWKFKQRAHNSPF
jgi:hypothetical protein